MDIYSNEQKIESARDLMEWVQAYIAAGFTREEAIELMVRPVVQVTSSLTPEMNEWISKMNLMADDAISDR